MKQLFHLGRRVLEKANGGEEPPHPMQPRNRLLRRAPMTNPPWVGGGAASSALGIERLGLVSLAIRSSSAFSLSYARSRHRSGSAVLSWSRRIRSAGCSHPDTPNFNRRADAPFPFNEFDVLVVVEGKSLLERNSLEKFRIW